MHDETVRRAFAKQATRFGDKGLTLSSQEYLAWMVDILPLRPGFSVLDVAAGTGYLSRAIAPHVKEVVAIDMTPGMLAEARKEIEKRGLTNITLEEGSAEQLPYADESFHMVVSRLAVHHFEHPQGPLQEMVRVCKSSHSVGVIDLLSPDDERLLDCYNRLERLRDRSHAMALTQKQLVEGMEEARLVVDGIDARDIAVDFGRWVEMTGTDRGTREAIERELLQEVEGGSKTGMRPYVEGGKLKFLQTWAIVIGHKRTEQFCAREK